MILTAKQKQGREKDCHEESIASAQLSTSYGRKNLFCLNLYASLPQGAVLQIASAIDSTSEKHLSMCLIWN